LGWDTQKKILKSVIPYVVRNYRFGHKKVSKSGIESPWKIIYKIDNDIVNILIVIDSRRNTQDILIEKLIK